MGHRLTKIYTRTGDEGETAIGDGSRIAKDHPRVEAMGEIDELNSVLGLLATHALPDGLTATLSEIQHDLFDLGGELSMPGHAILPSARTEFLETVLDRLNGDLPPLKEFILPGGCAATATCHLARTVCRRAERRLSTLHRDEPVRPELMTYVNRLSDLLFVLARVIARAGNVGEVYWRHRRSPGSSPAEGPDEA